MPPSEPKQDAEQEHLVPEPPEIQEVPVPAPPDVDVPETPMVETEEVPVAEPECPVPGTSEEIVEVPQFKPADNPGAVESPIVAHDEAEEVPPLETASDVEEGVSSGMAHAEVDVEDIPVPSFAGFGGAVSPIVAVGYPEAEHVPVPSDHEEEIPGLSDSGSDPEQVPQVIPAPPAEPPVLPFSVQDDELDIPVPPSEPTVPEDPGAGSAEFVSWQGEEGTNAYHTETILPNGRYTVLIDSGAVGNLCGSAWAKAVGTQALQRGDKPIHKERARPLTVSGVGNGSQRCTHNSVLPFRMVTTTGRVVSPPYEAATVPQSQLPGLLGLESLRRNRCVLDFTNLKLHMCGPDDVNIEGALPEGTDTFQCEITPSGHLAVPCCEPAHKGARAEPEVRCLTTTTVKSPEPAVSGSKPAAVSQNADSIPSC